MTVVVLPSSVPTKKKMEVNVNAKERNSMMEIGDLRDLKMVVTIRVLELMRR